MTEVHIESADADMDFEDCPCCGENEWLRLLAVYKLGTCYVVYCSDCGKPVEERWSIIP